MNLSQSGEKLDKLDKRIEEMETISANNNTQNNNQSTNHSSPYLKLFLIILYPFLLLWFFFNIGLKGSDILANTLTSAFGFIAVDKVLNIIPGETYIAFMTLYATFILYADFLFLFPYAYFTSTRTKIGEKIGKQITFETIGFTLLILPLAITIILTPIFWPQDASAEQNRENFEINTANQWSKFWHEDLCFLSHFSDPTYCLKQEETADAKQTYRSEYDIDLKQPETKYIPDLTRFKEYPYQLIYEIKAKGEPIYLERIECYANKVSKDTFLSNKSLDRQEIITGDQKIPIDTTYCDIKDLKTESQLDKNFKLITILYYEVESTYSQPIPIYNMDIYLENKYGSTEGTNNVIEEAKIREELGKIKPVATNNALELSTYTVPLFPIFIGSDYADRDKYLITFTFEKTTYSDKLISSEITDYKVPSIFTLECDGSYCENIKGPMTTYDDKSTIVLDLSVNDPGEQRESFNQNIDITVRNKFKKQNTIPLTINNPDYKEDHEQKEQDETSTETPEVKPDSSPSQDTVQQNNDPVEEILKEDTSDPLQNDDGWELIS